MAATGRQLIQRALMEIGFLAAGEVTSPLDEQNAHLIAKRMVNAMGAERLRIFDLLRTAQALTAGTRDYTIGPSATINIARPLWVEHAGYIPDSTATDPLETPIEVFTDQRWAAIRLKTFSGTPLLGVYLDDKFDANGLATLSTYPTITGSNRQLVIYTPRAVTGFDSLADPYVFSPGYEDAWHYELSYRLQRPFGKPLDPQLETDKIAAWARLERLNVHPGELVCDPAVRSATRGGLAGSAFHSGNF